MLPFLSCVLLMWLFCCVNWYLFAKRNQLGLVKHATIGFGLALFGLALFIGLNFVLIQTNTMPRAYYYAENQLVVIVLISILSAISMFAISRLGMAIAKKRLRKNNDWKNEMDTIGKPDQI